MFRPQEYEARLLVLIVLSYPKKSGCVRQLPDAPSEVLGIRIGYFSSDERLRN
jgi:hypothetical protein